MGGGAARDDDGAAWGLCREVWVEWPIGATEGQGVRE